MRVSFEYKGLEVEANVEAERDPYGTGDSPASYEVDILYMYDAENKRVDEDDISREMYDAIIEEAIDEYLN